MGQSEGKGLTAESRVAFLARKRINQARYRQKLKDKKSMYFF